MTVECKVAGVKMMLLDGCGSDAQASVRKQKSGRGLVDCC